MFIAVFIAYIFWLYCSSIYSLKHDHIYNFKLRQALFSSREDLIYQISLVWLKCSIPVKWRSTLNSWLEGLATDFFRDSNTQNSRDITVINGSEITSDGYFQEWTTVMREERVSSLHLVSIGHHQTPPTLTVCVSQHVFPIWFHPVPQHWVHADLFPPSFFFFHLSFYCFILSLAAKYISPSLNPSLTPSLSLSPFTLISTFHPSSTFISVTQHLDLMLVSLWVCVRLTLWCHRPQLSRARYHIHAVIPSSLSFVACHSASCGAKDNHQQAI